MYGRHLFFSGLYLGLLACPLLAVADFTSSDSSTLAHLSSVVDDISGNAARTEGMVGDIQSWLENNLSDLGTDILEIKSYAEWSYDRLGIANTRLGTISTTVSGIASELASHAAENSANLRDLRTSNNAISSTLSTISDLISRWSFSSNSTSGVSGVITNFVNVDLSGISNAIANLPLCSVVVTNFLNSSGNVDMTMVTNLAAFFLAGYDQFNLGAVVAGDFTNEPLLASLASFLNAMGFSGDEEYFRYAFAASPFGMFLWLLQSALPFDGYAPDFWHYSTLYWGKSSSGVNEWDVPDWKYTIFEAYNTIGTTNLLSRILSKIDDISSGSSSSTSEAVASIDSSLYSPAEETPLDWSTNANHVEWEETYHTGISEYTNALAYQQYSDQYVEGVTNMFSKFSTQLQTVQSDGDPLLNLAFSGWHFNEKFPSFPSIRDGWQFDLMPDPDDPHWKGFSDFTHGIWLAFWRLLQAFVVIYGSVRVYKIVFPAGYYDIS